MIRGEHVVVRIRSRGGTDAGGNPVWVFTPQVVDNVLVAPGPRSDVDGSTRPDGVSVRWTLHFPKSFTGDLRGAEVLVRGETTPYGVVGDPAPYTPENTPGAWNLPVELVRIDG